MPDAGTYLRICHLNSPSEATFQLLKMFADQDRVPQDSVSQDSVPQDSVPQGSEPQVIVTLTEADIPGALHALLNEPLEAHNVAALKRWLLCHDIKPPSSCRKRQLIQHQQHNGHDELLCGATHCILTTAFTSAHLLAPMAATRGYCADT